MRGKADIGVAGNGKNARRARHSKSELPLGKEDKTLKKLPKTLVKRRLPFARPERRRNSIRRLTGPANRTTMPA